ncbi:DUF5068 domain-containing protein [Pontibacillus salicampi]|uniref:DUF5068 domain-containing protein n=1 Tax=Pontibacillus salicampi TaxID=1449801 RepID=A0ABV6LLV7_9BACI
MRKFTLMLMVSLWFILLILSACGSEEDAAGTEESESDVKEEETKSEDTTVETDTTSIEEDETASNTSSENKEGMINPSIKEKSGGEVDVVYTNEDPQYSHDMEGFKVAVNQYDIVKVTGMSDEYAIPFDDQADGYVVTADVTIHNTKDKAMYYNNMYRIQLSNEVDYIQSDTNRTFVDDQYPSSEKESEPSKYAAGEKVSGLISFTLTKEEFQAVKNVNPKFIIEGGVADNKQYSGAFQEDATFDFAYSGEQSKENASNDAFYPDRMTNDNLADKKMISDQKVNESKQIGDVNVTVEGVQYTEIIPTKGNEQRFSNFGDSGIVSVGVKVNLDNQSEQTLSIWNVGSELTIDEGSGIANANLMAEPRNPRELEAGEEGTKYHVFLFEKKNFETFESIELTFGPFVAEDGSGMFEEGTANFSLPMP